MRVSKPQHKLDWSHDRPMDLRAFIKELLLVKTQYPVDINTLYHL